MLWKNALFSSLGGEETSQKHLDTSLDTVLIVKGIK